MGLSTAGIGSIGGLSSASMNPIQQVTYRESVDQAYTIDNQSDFSDAFVDSVRDLSSAESVEGVPPVQYPTANVLTRRIGQIEEGMRVNAGYNSIAAGYEGVTVGYGRGGAASQGFGMVGSTIDLFA